MKLIGILGGTSWPSTVIPYRMLNQEVQRRLGPTHSARIVLYSIDYAAIRACYSGDWSAIPPLLLAEIRTLLSFRPDCWMIANNTLHGQLPAIAHHLPADPPLFHAIDLVRDHLVAQGYRKVLLLGTRYTMESGYYADPIRAAGIDVEVPDEADRVEVGAIQSRLANGEMEPGWADWFSGLIARHAAAGCQAVIAGCTELPLVIAQDRAPVEVVDPLWLQCKACLDLVLD